MGRRTAGCVGCALGASWEAAVAFLLQSQRRWCLLRLAGDPGRLSAGALAVWRWAAAGVVRRMDASVARGERDWMAEGIDGGEANSSRSRFGGNAGVFTWAGTGMAGAGATGGAEAEAAAAAGAGRSRRGGGVARRLAPEWAFLAKGGPRPPLRDAPFPSRGAPAH